MVSGPFPESYAYHESKCNNRKAQVRKLVPYAQAMVHNKAHTGAVENRGTQASMTAMMAPVSKATISMGSEGSGQISSLSKSVELEENQAMKAVDET